MQGRIHSDRDGAKRFIGEHIGRLEARLKELGFSEVSLLAARTEPDAETWQRFEQLEQMAPAATHLLDVTV